MRTNLFSIFIVSASIVGCGAKATPPSTPSDVQNVEPGGGGAALAASTEGSAAAPASDGKTRFVFVVPPSGTKRSEIETFDFKLDVTVSEKGKAIGSETSVDTKKMVRHSTVMENDGKVITAKKVHYEEMVKTSVKGARQISVPSPLTGKTYRVTLKDGAVVVTGLKNEPVSDVERDLVVEDNKDLGKPPGFASLLPGMALSAGEKFTPPPEALGELSGGQGSGRSFRDVEFTFKGPEDSAGKRVNRFDFSMLVEDTSSPLMTTIRMQGTVRLLSDTGWPVDSTMTGQITVAGPGGKPSQKVDGKGTIEAKRSARYE